MFKDNIKVFKDIIFKDIVFKDIIFKDNKSNI